MISVARRNQVLKQLESWKQQACEIIRYYPSTHEKDLWISNNYPVEELSILGKYLNRDTLRSYLYHPPVIPMPDINKAFYDFSAAAQVAKNEVDVSHIVSCVTDLLSSLRSANRAR